MIASIFCVMLLPCCKILVWLSSKPFETVFVAGSSQLGVANSLSSFSNHAANANKLISV
jgi:hypothetical protein